MTPRVSHLMNWLKVSVEMFSDKQVGSGEQSIAIECAIANAAVATS